MKRTAVHSVLAAALAAVPALPAGSAAAADWKPDKNVELNLGSGPGSGSDIIARTLQGVWQSRGLVKPSVTVVNRPNIAIATLHVHQQPGNAHQILFTSATLLTNHITGVSPIKHTELTPIAILGEEPIIFSVRADSRLKSGKDLVEALRKDAGSISVGIASALGNHNHTAVAMVTKEAGGDVKALKVVVFGSSSKGLAALLGGHVDLYASSIDAAVPHMQAGRIRALAVATDKRLRDDVSAVPTWREQGIKATANDIRILTGPGRLNDAQVAFWDDALAKTTQSEEWKKFEAAGYAVPAHRNSAEAAKYLDASYNQLRAILGELGLAKQ